MYLEEVLKLHQMITLFYGILVPPCLFLPASTRGRFKMAQGCSIGTRRVFLAPRTFVRRQNQAGKSIAMSRPDPERRDPNNDPDPVQVLGNVILGIGQLLSRIPKWIKSGAGMLTLLSLFMLGVGGVGGHFLGSLLSSTSSASSTEISFIENAKITNFREKNRPQTGENQHLVYVSFPDPRQRGDCDGECTEALVRITEGFRGCEEGTCSAELKNVDQPDLKSGAASHIENVLSKGKGELFDLVVSGVRINRESEYPNIILFRPSGSRE
ncbi:hypothetical protein [Streptomyces sp. NPDC014734]|uniref:hypothetical protein n=1 Tax=Streptomyces sp. NPDC014734 TaxID=3364886 RepID=UPI0036FE0363